VEPLVAVSESPSTVTVNPGSSAQATLTFTSHVPHDVNVTYTATPPSGSGLTATPATTTVTVPPQGTSTSETVTAGSGVTVGTYQIPVTLTADDQGQAYTDLPTGQIQVAVPYASVAAAYDNPGISDNSATSAGGFDGAGGDSYSAEALASASPTPLTPGAQVTVSGVNLTWPNVQPGQDDNVIAEGQAIDLSGSGNNLVLLAASNNGTGSGTLTINYADGTSQQVTINAGDWYYGTPGAGEQLLTTTPYWNQNSGPGTQPVSIYSNTIPLESGKTVQSIILPDVSTGVGGGENAMHIFAAGIG